MDKSRRDFMAKAARTSGAAVVIALIPKSARACLYGKWWVVCPNGHVDLVDDGTCQHKCEKCGVQAFQGSIVTVRCPNGHDNRIDTAPCGRACTGFNCPTCGSNCRVG
jgi:hypothetical protein